MKTGFDATFASSNFNINMDLTPLTAIAPIDGRYHSKTKELSDFYSEKALIKYRVIVELGYFKALVDLGLPQLSGINAETILKLDEIVTNFSSENAQSIKEIEKVTNHDVKAVEYFIKEEFDKIGLSDWKEFIHFGLTSQDVNNTATPLMIKDSIEKVFLPNIEKIIGELESLVDEWKDVPLLARTHGQPASPTRLGKEFEVFVKRLKIQLEQVKAVPFSAKFGGATGNFNAHYATYPDIEWHTFGNQFVENYLGLSRSHPTTQIEHYDNLGALFHGLSRINTILIDFCRDVWTYVSMDYFKQKVVKNEVGSSAMPHKVNPIDFENAEGNLGIANAIFGHLAEKLPISRLQRDLTDSTVLRNVGVPMAHTLIAFKSILKGLNKLLLNESKIQADLEANWMVVAEGIQNILRREGYPKPYEALKALTRGNHTINSEVISNFIDDLDVSDSIKNELKTITPQNYVGK